MTAFATYDAQRLRDAMTFQGRTNQWLAARIDYTEEHVSRVLAGIHPMTAKFATRSALALGIPVHFFLRSETPEPVAA